MSAIWNASALTYDDDAVDDDDDDVNAVLPFYNGIVNNIRIYYAMCACLCPCVVQWDIIPYIVYGAHTAQHT